MFYLLIIDANVVDEIPWEEAMYEELSLPPSFAIPIGVCVVPIRCCHNLPVQLVQICKINEKLAKEDYGMPFGEDKT